MGLLNKLLSSGIGEVAKGIGSLAIDLRSAITGDLPPKEKAELERIAFALEGKQMELEVQMVQVQSSVIIAETKSESWLARNWRPLLMTMFGVIIANNYIFFPYIELFAGPEYAVQLTIPTDMWGLLKLGVSGYVVGRSAEKIAGGEGLKSIFKKLAG